MVRWFVGALTLSVMGSNGKDRALDTSCPDARCVTNHQRSSPSNHRCDGLHASGSPAGPCFLAMPGSTAASSKDRETVQASRAEGNLSPAAHGAFRDCVCLGQACIRDRHTRRLQQQHTLLSWNHLIRDAFDQAQ